MGEQQVEAKRARCSSSCASRSGAAAGTARARLSRSLRRGHRRRSAGAANPPARSPEGLGGGGGVEH